MGGKQRSIMLYDSNDVIHPRYGTAKRMYKNKHNKNETEKQIAKNKYCQTFINHSTAGSLLNVLFLCFFPF